MKNLICLLLFILGSFTISYTQKYQENELRKILDSLSVKHSGLNNSLQLNVYGLPMYELITSVAMENNLNITIDPTINQVISYNFFDASVKDMLVFIYKNFEVEFEFVGTIISIKKRTTKTVLLPPVIPKNIDVSYNELNEFLSMNLRNDTLWKVLEKISKITDRNFIISPEIRDKQVNAYFQNRPFEQVMEMFVKSNSLLINKEREGQYYIGAENTLDTRGGINGKGNNNAKNISGRTVSPGSENNLNIIKNENGKLDVSANSIDLSELLKAAAAELNIHYVLHSNLEGKANIEIRNVTFDDLLKKLFNGSKYNYRKEAEFFIIGDIKMEGLRKTELIRLENRTIENVKVVIPKELITELEITEFVELNGLIVSGSERAVSELKQFLRAIDIVVPMVQIDVMLIVSKTGSAVNTGVKAGLKDNPTTTKGTVFPGLDVEMGASAINFILNAITGFGFVNLGQVTENFYLSLQALESNNVLNIESTPKISTLNGHQAKISIGETTYYQETQVNVQTTINNQGILQSKIWKSIDANLTVVIKPFVSADEYVTLTINVDQNDFSGRVDESAPPNATTQKFESMVRVKNGEVILLGGLEEKSSSQAGSGVPFLSRIPVLRWFFSSRTKSKEKSKLHLLIKPTVTY
jgi:type IV pilus assembly protein PilQ